MKESSIREPVQKRSIEKKEKIIKCGFELICKKGYYNTNTAEIAKAAGVSTGIVYNYFKDKHDILIEGIKIYADDIFYPMLNIAETQINKNNIENVLREMINKFIENHKLSQQAHEEITAMTQSDKEIAEFFQQNEMTMTKNISRILVDNGFDSKNLDEKVHIAIHLIDDLCHEIVYHKHKDLDYNVMINLVIENILNFM